MRRENNQEVSKVTSLGRNGGTHPYLRDYTRKLILLIIVNVYNVMISKSGTIKIKHKSNIQAGLYISTELPGL